MENFSKEILVAIREYYIEDVKDIESLKLVRDCFRYLYRTTEDKKMQEEILDYAWENKFCLDCGETLKYYGEENEVEFWDCPCAREV